MITKYDKIQEEARPVRVLCTFGGRTFFDQDNFRAGIQPEEPESTCP
jgi:hypothetical protein